MNREKPLLIYDGDCGFCKQWILRSHAWTGDLVEYSPSQQVGSNFSDITPEQFQQSIWLIEKDEKRYHSAEAAFRVLTYANKPLLYLLYQRFAFIRILSEWTYRLVARNRKIISKLDLFFVGRESETTHLITSLFLRCIGIIYFFAFASLFSQLPGLIGHNGILPVDHILPAIRNAGYGIFTWPTLLWIHPSIGFAQGICGLGIVASLLIVFDLLILPSLIFTWIFYLSLTTVGMDFLSFQWDALLLEVGFLSIFVSWWRSSTVFVWLFRFLLFRLMFSSGMVKLASGDPAWRDLTALDLHFETQPLPTWIGFYAHQLSPLAHKFCTLGMFAIEIFVPFFIFPFQTRRYACFFLVLLQIIILLTGNYAFFNWLTIAMCFLLLNDKWVEKRLPAPVINKLKPKKSFRFQPQWVVPFVSVIILFLSLNQIISLFSNPVSSWRKQLVGAFEPFRIVNSYGLFAVMTTERREIVIEGSEDGTTWLPYEFKYRPGDESIRPGFIAPFQPRLDWQMWFAALSDFDHTTWFQNMIIRLFEGSTDVENLFKTNPFPDHPPKKLRASLVQYHFVDLPTHQKNHTWWKKEYVRSYMDPISR